ncbi:DUF7096 domain-containing protein [Natrarchaeobaculum sulfurireducens]|uniref:Secreted protein, component of type IV pili likesystem n=1 Tax=Natrarchaeobaculum sulfurireducens TaxID=2044521 RepID=A0A346PBA1_9EURY|nr:hypothetical protein [Natrarchaeobaculum sulfurireducens]AXR76796.1 Secreted protein, component of type IV pili likesystem [Natrarchaeobaculum sulfurireducens]AXR80466.1 hypothetical protein AArcMg_0443 [Natrarchaeobaculum sulfurireducens]
MNDALPPLLALVLVLSLPATALAAADYQGENDVDSSMTFHDGVAGQVSPVDVDETTNRLPLLDPVEYDYATRGPDLGATLAGTDDELRIDHSQYVLVDREFDEADDGERAEMLEDAHDALQDHIRDLDERERDVVREHATGERSDDDLVETVLGNYYEATKLLDVLNHLDDRADEVPGYSLSSSQVREDRRAIEAHQSPIKSDIAAAAEEFDSTDRFEFLIQTSHDGYRLSTIDGQTYVFETTRFDNYDPDTPDQFADQNQTGLDYAEELYPWAASEGSPDYTQAGSIHDVRFTDNDFDVRMFIDGGSGEVYREYQELSIDRLPIVEEWTVDDDGLELSIQATPADGPVEATVTDAETGEPEQATIFVDDHELGVTDEDGIHWFVPPMGEYELTAETETESVTTTIDLGG